MATVEDELVYAAVSSNRNENNISTLDRYLLYSRCLSPVLYNLESKLISAILIGHTAEVNGQCFVDSIDGGEPDRHLHVISTAHDNSAIVWRVSRDTKLCSAPNQYYEIMHKIESPDGSVFKTRSSIRTHQGQYLTILTSMNGNIYLYQDEHLLQTIPTKDCYFDSKFHLMTYCDDNGEKRQIMFVALAGFSDWIKCVAFHTLPDRNNECLLATACQDSLIQVWHLRLTNLPVSEATRVRTRVSKSIWNESDVKLTSTLETVLSGHVGFVHGLCWFNKNTESRRLQLISCSSDRTIVIWRSAILETKSDTQIDARAVYEPYPASEGVWQEFRRLGETGEVNLPFLGVCLSCDESTLYAQSLRGAIHSWSLSKDPARPDQWFPSETISGHFDSVTDLAWERTGAYLLSSSLDKTCRLHTVARSDGKWHELARPQVHGYEVNCLASLNFLKFASGAEEKTIRTFEATKFFIKNYKALAKSQVPEYCLEDLEAAVFDELPAHAQLPALGLSNRGSQCPFDVNETDGNESTGKISDNTLSQQSGDRKGGPVLSDNNSWQEVSDLVHQLARIDHLNTLPYEEILLLSTLWWEKNKLFGHYNELHALASDSRGTFLASASKANRADLAGIIVWETEKFRKVATIEHHSLTITRLAFSPDDKYLLSISRDRTWCLSERNPSGQLRNAYRKLVGTVKSNAVHERIIWDCCWTFDSQHFLTVSRDKKAILWSIQDLRSHKKDESSSDKGSENAPETPLNLRYASSRTFKGSIQATESTQTEVIVNKLSAAPSYLFALGFEDGSLELHSVDLGAACDNQWRLLVIIPKLHQLSIRRLAFRPQQTDDDVQKRSSQEFMLASGADDSTVKITKLRITPAD